MGCEPEGRSQIVQLKLEVQKLNRARWRRWLLVLALPGALAIVGASVAASAASAPATPPTNQAQATDVPEAADSPDTTAAETTNPSEPAGSAEVGHQDTSAQTDHQFDGSE